MDNFRKARRSRKRHRKRPRSVSSSSENLDVSVSRSSSRRHKSKRRRRHLSKRRRSKERQDYRKKSMNRATSERNRSENVGSVPVQINNAITSEAVQYRANSRHRLKAAEPVVSTRVGAVPSTSSAHLNGSQHHGNTTQAKALRQPHESGKESLENGRKTLVPNTRSQARKNNRSNAVENSDCYTQQSRSESELQCSICSELFIKATMLNCIHTFCKYCIDMWKRNKAECPLCRTPITSECRIAKFDLMIEQITHATEDSKKLRLEILKEREELEENFSNQQRQSSTQQRELRTPSPQGSLQLGDFNSSDDTNSDNVYNDVVVFTDDDGEHVYSEYNYFNDTDEDDYMENFAGDEDNNGYTDNDDNDNHDGDELQSDFNRSGSELEAFEGEDGINYSDNNGSISEHYDENVSTDDLGESNDGVEGEGYEIDGDGGAYEEVNASDNSDDNVDDAYDNEDDGDNDYEDNIGSGDSDGNTDHESYEHNDDDDENAYEDDNGSGNSDGNLDDEPHDNEHDVADYEDNNYNSDNSEHTYDDNDNCDNDSDCLSYDDDYEYE